MPIYEYQCAACGQVVEKWQKISEEPLSTCPTCGGALSKLISSCAFHLKGSGWYVTDYSGSRSGASASHAADSATKSESADSSAPATDTKAAEKAGSAAPAKKFQ